MNLKFIIGSLLFTSLLFSSCFKEGEISELPDYAAPIISFSTSSLSVPEGNKDSTILVGVQLKGENRTQVLVKYQVNGATAVAGTDFEAVADGKLFFKPGKHSDSFLSKYMAMLLKKQMKK